MENFEQHVDAFEVEEEGDEAAAGRVGPLKSIRAHCLECTAPMYARLGSQPHAVQPVSR